MPVSKSPQLFAHNYFDSLIRQVDIHTEEQLDLFGDDDLLTDSNQQPVYDEESIYFSSSMDICFLPIDQHDKSLVEASVDPYVTRYDLDIELNMKSNKTSTKNEIKTREYLNATRELMIAELKSMQSESLKKLDTNKFKASLSTSCDVFELFEAGLFDEKFAFVLEINEIRMGFTRVENQSPFKIYLIELDFYLKRKSQKLLCHLLTDLGRFKGFAHFSERISLKETSFSSHKERHDQLRHLNQENLLVTMLFTYIHCLLSSRSRPTNPVIRIQKSQILSLRRLKSFEFDIINIDTGYEEFNHLKSINLYRDFRADHEYRREFHTLKGLKNLEFLDLCYFTLFKSPLEQLVNLRHLALSNSDLKAVDSRIFADVPRLEVLELRDLQNYSHIDFGLLLNLKWLLLEHIDPSLFLTRLSPHLRVLKLIDSFQHGCMDPKSFQHQNLISLDLTGGFDHDLSTFDAKCLSNLSGLKYLKLGQFIRSVNLDYEFLAGLESLDLENNHFECLDFAFAKLSNLKSLKLSYNEHLLVGPEIFVGLKNLELLEMKRVVHENLTLSPDLFSHQRLDRLTTLNLCNNQLISLESSVFAHLPSLERLDLSFNFLQPDAETFSNLKRLKFLNLSDNKLDSLEPGVFKWLSVLSELNLSSNRLRRIARQLLVGLDSLRVLALNLNPINSIDIDVFLEMPSLELVELTRTNLLDENQIYIQKMLKSSIKILL